MDDFPSTDISGINSQASNCSFPDTVVANLFVCVVTITFFHPMLAALVKTLQYELGFVCTTEDNLMPR